jgi:hypothetical protein
MALRKEEEISRCSKLLKSVFPDFALRLRALGTQMCSYISYRGDEPIEMPLPPLTNDTFDFLENVDVGVLLMCLDLRAPSTGEVYWRIMPSTTTEDVDRWMESILTE